MRVQRIVPDQIPLIKSPVRIRVGVGIRFRVRIRLRVRINFNKGISQGRNFPRD